MTPQILRSIYRPISEYRYVGRGNPRAQLQSWSQQELMDYTINKILIGIDEVEKGYREIKRFKHRGIIPETPIQLLATIDGVVNLSVEYLLGKDKQRLDVEMLRFQLDFLSQDPKDKREYEMLRTALDSNRLRTCNENLFYYSQGH